MTNHVWKCLRASFAVYSCTREWFLYEVVDSNLMYEYQIRIQCCNLMWYPLYLQGEQLQGAMSKMNFKFGLHEFSYYRNRNKIGTESTKKKVRKSLVLTLDDKHPTNYLEHLSLLAILPFASFFLFLDSYFLFFNFLLNRNFSMKVYGFSKLIKMSIRKWDFFFL